MDYIDTKEINEWVDTEGISLIPALENITHRTINLVGGTEADFCQRHECSYRERNRMTEKSKASVVTNTRTKHRTETDIY